ncbi:MAG: stage III sporulation protein AA [Eubacteriaceae bacterium]
MNKVFYERIEKDLKEIIFRACELKIKNILSQVDENLLLQIDEIRLRAGKPLMLCKSKEDFMIDRKGNITSDLKEAYIVKENEIYNSLQLLSQYSLYSIEEELSKGYITLKGGHRVGICGKVVLEKGYIKTIKYVNGLNYRIMREVLGCGTKLMKIIRNNRGEVYHSLIVGPPKSGKTTILRDLVRQLSIGDDINKGLNIGVVDERSEIAGCYKGVPQNDIGIRTDVLDCCPKAQGIINMIRSMSPDVIVTDEIGSKEDLLSIHEALNAGIKIITTVHGASMEEILNRPYVCQMVKEKLFKKIIFLNNTLGPGTISQVVDVDEFFMLGKKNVH